MNAAADTNRRVGSTLASLLREDGSYEEVRNHAIKSVLAYKLAGAMKAQKLSTAGMASRTEKQSLAARPTAGSG